MLFYHFKSIADQFLFKFRELNIIYSVARIQCSENFGVFGFLTKTPFSTSLHGKYIGVAHLREPKSIYIYKFYATCRKEQNELTFWSFQVFLSKSCSILFLRRRLFFYFYCHVGVNSISSSIIFDIIWNFEIRRFSWQRGPLQYTSPSGCCLRLKASQTDGFSHRVYKIVMSPMGSCDYNNKNRGKMLYFSLHFHFFIPLTK